MLIFYKFKQKSTMYWIIISSAILGPQTRLGPPHCGGCGGGSYATGFIDQLFSRMKFRTAAVRKINSFDMSCLVEIPKFAKECQLLVRGIGSFTQKNAWTLCLCLNHLTGVLNTYEDLRIWDEVSWIQL